MTKRWFSIPAFLTAWMFLFSALSVCYCAPVSFTPNDSAQSDLQSKMPAHCQHHSGAAKEKKSDCAPRYNTDQFENQSIAVKASAPQKSTLSFVEDSIDFSRQTKAPFYRSVSPPTSPPSLEYYVLHHSFLI